MAVGIDPTSKLKSGPRNSPQTLTYSTKPL
jgi:hypothetical protein